MIKINSLLGTVFLILFVSCVGQTDTTFRFPLANDQNIDESQLVAAFDKAAQITEIRSLVVSRNEVIVAEEYFNGGSSEPDGELHVMSVTKSITSLLVGIAMDKGFIESVDQTVSDFLGDEVDAVNPGLGQITLKQLLTMTSGHEWMEIDDGSEFIQWINAPNQLDYVMEKAIVNEPGTLFDYSDGAAHLVSYILEKATGMNTSLFADAYLFEPMGLGPRGWYVDNQGISFGGVGLLIGAHDMQKIGHMILNNGFYNDQQIVSSSWIEESITTQFSPITILPHLSSYGYYWWIGSRNGVDYICALGYGGQFILIVEDKDLVATATCNYQTTEWQAGRNWTNIFNILITDILPAVD